MHHGIAILLGLLALAPACSSSKSGSSSSAVFCSTDVGGVPNACAGFKSMPASDQKSYKDQCTQGGGTIVSACPTQNLLGCCTRKGVQGYAITSCVYGASSSDAGSTGDAGSMGDVQKQQCESSGGTWSTTP